MTEVKINISHPIGFHARPSAVFVTEARKHPSEIRLITDKGDIDGKSIVMLMGAGIKSGDQVTIRVSGEEEEKVMDHLLEVIKKEKIGTAV